MYRHAAPAAVTDTHIDRRASPKSIGVRACTDAPSCYWVRMFGLCQHHPSSFAAEAKPVKMRVKGESGLDNGWVSANRTLLSALLYSLLSSPRTIDSLTKISFLDLAVSTPPLLLYSDILSGEQREFQRAFTIVGKLIIFDGAARAFHAVHATLNVQSHFGGGQSAQGSRNTKGLPQVQSTLPIIWRAGGILGRFCWTITTVRRHSAIGNRQPGTRTPARLAGAAAQLYPQQ